MWVEREIEGDRNERMQRDAGPLNSDTIWQKFAQARDLARHRVLDRRRLDHVLTSTRQP